MEWLVIINIENLIEWVKKSDGIYKYIHPHLKEKI